VRVRAGKVEVQLPIETRERRELSAGASAPSSASEDPPPDSRTAA
jgi:hypothetical protein